MPDMEDPSPKPPQISEMFQKFAQAFKTKTIEFFAEEEDDPQDDFETLSLLDSAEEIITNQRVVVIKPDSIKPDFTLPQTLIPSVFATVASFEASYLQLQTAHSPFDAPAIEAADRAAVGHLKKLWEMNKWYREFRKNLNPRFTPNFGSQLEAQVQENQSLLRTLEMLVNRLQSEIDSKDAEVLLTKRKLRKREEANSKLSKRAKRLLNCEVSSFSCSPDKLLSITVFDSVLQYLCKSCRRFTKILVDLMKKVGWDLDSAASSVYPDVEYAKIGHNRYAFLSYICLGMFRGFDSERFLLEDDGIECNGDISISDKKKSSLSQFVKHATGDAIEILNSNQNGCFARFCEMKYQNIVHPTMESSIFKDLDHNELVISLWRSSPSFYQTFVDMASSVWMLHKLAFSFDPVVEIFQVEKGADFSMIYMENVTGNSAASLGKTRAKVAFTVIPGFKIGRTIVQSQVYLTGKQPNE